MSTLALIDRITRPLALEGEVVDALADRTGDALLPELLPVVSRVPVRVREATLADLPFIDALQKKHAKAVGWMPTMQLEGKIAQRQVLVAEEDLSPRRRGDAEEVNELNSELLSAPPSLSGERLGYVIGNDRYFKRDDVGIIYQMNVVPAAQRGLIGATLLKAMFERSAYGCRLFCCWCAQDLAANRFWESMGFVPLAFRAGSERKSRVHIFWQKRIRAGDDGNPTHGGTPWWFPAQTSSGSIREDRLVLPIPPGTHWSDAKPMVLPACADDSRRVNTAQRSARKRNAKAAGDGGQCPPYGLSGLRLGVAETAKGERRKEPREKRKNDPALVAQARELRDRWLEHVAANPAAITAGGKYDVARIIAESGVSMGKSDGAVAALLDHALDAPPLAA